MRRRNSKCFKLNLFNFVTKFGNIEWGNLKVIFNVMMRKSFNYSGGLNLNE
jgi:hypothetical protein